MAGVSGNKDVKNVTTNVRRKDIANAIELLLSLMVTVVLLLTLFALADCDCKRLVLSAAEASAGEV